MKLKLVPAKQGLQWVGRGIRTFLRQPLALASLFLTMPLLVSLLGLIPVVGAPIALILMPSLVAGFLAAVAQANQGSFPMPWVVFSALRKTPEQTKAILTLGFLYAACILLAMGILSVLDGGQMAKFGADGANQDVATLTDFRLLLLSLASNIMLGLISILFAQAAALIYWHSTPAVKSLFFSVVNCWRNSAALLAFAAGWMAVVFVISILVALIAVLLGDLKAIVSLVLPVAFFIAAMFFTSLYFTFTDSFETSSGDTP